ncbi:CBS domain-containing protein [Streptomyces olivaceoviridis]|uniref:CBS domain-containing protein n=2 Tax=Streptomyces olivaceoviridis TaxID=1921 RepID=UPI0036C56B48
MCRDRSVTAGDPMATPAVGVTPEVTCARAARVMARRGVECLPVIGPDGALHGIVSRSDLLKVFPRDDQDIAEDVRYEAVARLFGTRWTRTGAQRSAPPFRTTTRICRTRDGRPLPDGGRPHADGGTDRWHGHPPRP